MSSLAKQVRPLLYLTYRSTFNGIKRALTSPRRLISLLMIVGYYFLMFIRPAMRTGRLDSDFSDRFPKLDFPPLEFIDAGVFTIFAAMSLFLMLGMFTVNLVYRAADVDILFPTPISPKTVLMFRIVRDYLATLIAPLLLAIIGLKPVRLGFEFMFRDAPEHMGLTIRLLTIGWLFMSLTFVCLGYAMSLWANRTDAKADNRSRFAGWATFAGIVLIGVYLWFGFSHVVDLKGGVAVLQDPILRTIFFVGTMATEMVMAPIGPHGIWGGLFGAGGLMALSVVGIYLALRQVGWLYDMAAMRAQFHSKEKRLQRSGDMAAIVAERARQGKVKRIKQTAINRVRWTGPWAMIWREILFARRSAMGMFAMMTVMAGFFVLMPTFMPAKEREMPIGIFVLFMQAMGSFMISTSVCATGFMEVLKRVDLLKPLPFSTTKIIFYETMAKVAFPTVVVWFFSLIAMVIRPSIASYALAGIFVAPGFNLLVGGTHFASALLFPDLEDASQRQFRGLVALLAVAILGSIPVGALAGLLALGTPPPVAGLVCGAICAGFGVLASAFSAQLFAGFNPAE